MKREARVFIRNSSPWITRVCPNCGARLNIDQPFCSQCGQEVSYENYHKVLEVADYEGVSANGYYCCDLGADMREVAMEFIGCVASGTQMENIGE